jgi:hypothetical protein
MKKDVPGLGLGGLITGNPRPVSRVSADALAKTKLSAISTTKRFSAKTGRPLFPPGLTLHGIRGPQANDFDLNILNTIQTTLTVAVFCCCMPVMESVAVADTVAVEPPPAPVTVHVNEPAAQSPPRPTPGVVDHEYEKLPRKEGMALRITVLPTFTVAALGVIIIGFSAIVTCVLPDSGLFAESTTLTLTV